MNTIVTSREAILKICRELVSENGLSSLNMRTVAQKCKIASGSLYNYFPSKSDLTIATIESVWQDIFHMERPCEIPLTFLEEVQRIFERVQNGMAAYPNFFTAHSISCASEDKGQARQIMERYFLHMENDLLESLTHDTAIRPNAFDEIFTPQAFVHCVLSGLLSILVQRDASCTVLLEMIGRTLYDRSDRAEHRLSMLP